MSDQTALYQWTGILRQRFGHLSPPQVRVLALWSLGMVLARSCALTAVSLRARLSAAPWPLGTFRPEPWPTALDRALARALVHHRAA